MKVLWNKITHIGVRVDHNAVDRRYILLINSLTIIVSILTFSYIPITIFTWEANSLIIVGFSVIFPIFLLCSLVLSYYEKFIWAKLNFVMNQLFVILLGHYILGGESSYYFFLLTLIIATFFIFSDKEHVLMYMFVTICLIAYLVIVNLYSDIKPALQFSESLLEFARISLLGGVGLYVVAFVYYVRSLFSITELALSDSLKKSDSLILNILPVDIARELQKDGISHPKKYDSVSVLFTDFVGFTKIAKDLAPELLVKELDQCFSYFDSVMQRYNLEKIKTIGDAYMCCGGLPHVNSTHPVDIILAAIEIQSFMNQMMLIKKSQNLPYWELRLGVNTGSLVAGVVGEKKFSYDVWGDTVNIASRMESSGENGKINISKKTYDIVKVFFECHYRGKVKAKNKGEIDMYFVTGILEQLSINGEQKVPNKKFHELYDAL